MCVAGCMEVVRKQISRRGLFMGGAAMATGMAGFSAQSVQAQARPTRVVDLTHTMSPTFPTFFGVPGVEFTKQFDFKKDGFNLNWWRITEHAGTHLDAPIHFSENGTTVDKLTAKQLVCPLAVIDVTAAAAANPDYQVSVADIRAWETSHGRIPNGACVAMNAGWSNHATDTAKFTGKDSAGVFHFPGFSPDATEFLLRERSVWGLAVDTMSLDHGPSKDFKTHYMWLPTGRWGLECVANLDQVPASGATIVVGVAKVKDATGGPARLIALV